MTGDDFRRRIAQAVEFVHSELRFTRTVSSLFSLRVNQDFNVVALNPTSTYAQIYRSAVSLSQYNFMLDDFSVFQFSWEGEGAWRLAYLPNPWLAGAESAQEIYAEWEALEALGGLDQEEISSLLDELPYQGAIPAIRFEYATAQYREIAHPAAHMHIGRHAENRWSLARPLDPLSFTMMIIRLYYPEIWNPSSSFHGAPEEGCFDQRFIEEMNRMRLVHQFSDTERRSLHLTSQ